MTCVLVIPTTGLLDLFQTEQPFDPDYFWSFLKDHKEGIGTPASVTATLDGQKFNIGMFINNPDQPINQRAREACAAFFGWHAVFAGPMFIHGLDPEQAAEILRVVS